MREVRLLRGGLLLAALSFAPGEASAQATTGHDAHAGHAGHGVPGATMEGGWIMPPMDPSMPMLPGLETAVPPVSAWLPGEGHDPSHFPEALPSQPVDLADGELLEVEVTTVRKRIGGHEYLMYGYNGQIPGPLIRAPRGATVRVRVTNRIPMETTVHWHGIRLDQPFDGVPGMPHPAIAPGESFIYEVKVPDGGLFWYHPHVREDIQQDLGMHGMLVVRDPDAPPPPVDRESLLVLDDLLVADDGRLIPWGEEAPTHAFMGRFGTVMLVNGETDHRVEVQPGEVVRFYLANVANARTFNVRFGGARVKLVASDQGPVEHQRWVESVVVAPSERYAVDVHFPEAGTVEVTNTIQAIDHFRGLFYPEVTRLATVVVGDPPDPHAGHAAAAPAASPDPHAGHGTPGAAPPAASPAPTAPTERAPVSGEGRLGSGDPAASFPVLSTDPGMAALRRELAPHLGRAPDHTLVATMRHRDLPNAIVLSMEIDTLYVPPMEWNDAMPEMNWLATGKQVEWILREEETGREGGDIQWRFRVGDWVKIRVFNDPHSFHPMNHPIHLHGQRFLVVTRDGVPQENLVWKDTAIVPTGSTMDLLVEMSNPGDWMFHCHIAEHLHTGMHFHFTVEE